VADYLGYPDPANILICNGAEEALYITLQGLVNEGDNIAIPDPDYPAYPTLVSLAGGQTVRLPFPDFDVDATSSVDATSCRINVNATSCRLRDKKPQDDVPTIKLQDEASTLELWEALLIGCKALLLSHPSNPSGFRFSASEFEQLAQILNRHGVILIVDEIYKDLYFDFPYEPDYTIINRVIRIGGLSKSHLMSGWRIGWLAGSTPEVSELTKLKQYISTCAAWPSQKLAEFALTQSSLVDDVRRQLSHNRDLCLATLPFAKVHAPMAGPYMMLRCQDGLEYAKDLLHKGIITVPGIAFGKVTQGYVRINIGVKPPLLERALALL
jgi:aspartate aminotransferase